MGSTNQPIWQCVAQLGDADPFGYGGYFVLVDKTGVYPPEVEVLEQPEDCHFDGRRTDRAARWQVYRFVLEPCTYVDGVLSDNKYHPGIRVWFADKIGDIARTCGYSELELLADFCSDDPIKRAHAWRAVGEYYGYHELDQYPLTLTRGEVSRRYRRAQYRVKGGV